MSTIVLRKLDDRLKTRLRIRAARHGRSMEEEARAILKNALIANASHSRDVARAIRGLIQPLVAWNCPFLKGNPFGIRRILTDDCSGFDAVIASIRKHWGATLATRNTSDFDYCGVALVNP